ncbi:MULTISPECIES: DUF6912 family protein [Actinotignum]|uniref:DUF6912 family protein n=1 Tax=Actinotignum TaxID=1653174 RepID=UPI00254BDE9F|nr:hypothetical protein [Actinotignum schaalii]MDE1536336.1 hypothetical protein [Actinotignum schaalii]MDK7271782.1 hypothetical protein [Actinotignum schaalii]
MRIYLPATPADVAMSVLSGRVVHAATEALAREVNDEDRDYLEAIAFNAAADDSLRAVSAMFAGKADPQFGVVLPERGGLRPRRVVIAAEVAPEKCRDLANPEEYLPTALQLFEELSWADVVSIHVDGPEMEPYVLAGPDDEAAFEVLAEEDLLWYDVSERLDLALELGAAASV